MKNSISPGTRKNQSGTKKKFHSFHASTETQFVYFRQRFERASGGVKCSGAAKSPKGVGSILCAAAAVAI